MTVYQSHENTKVLSRCKKMSMRKRNGKCVSGIKAKQICADPFNHVHGIALWILMEDMFSRLYSFLFLDFYFERQTGKEKEDTWHCWKIKSVTIRVSGMGVVKFLFHCCILINSRENINQRNDYLLTLVLKNLIQWSNWIFVNGYSF